MNMTQEEKTVLLRILLSAEESFYSAPEAYAESASEKKAFESVVGKVKALCATET